MKPSDVLELVLDGIESSLISGFLVVRVGDPFGVGYLSDELGLLDLLYLLDDIVLLFWGLTLYLLLSGARSWEHC